MDVLSQHEAFLRAIFDHPRDDTARLVYADFLEEHGDADRAAYIRTQCEAARAPIELWEDTQRRLNELRALHPEPWPWASASDSRGFPIEDVIELPGAELFHPDSMRAAVVAKWPHWFGAKTLKLMPPVIRAEHIPLLFALPFMQQAREWDLSGHVEEVLSEMDTDGVGAFGLIDMEEKPVITVAGVEALCEQRLARRITSLNLTHNNLDNDAARALVRSPYLANLTKLEMFEGNRFRGKTWSQLVERFGEGVVG